MRFLINSTEGTIKWIIDTLKKDQSPDGSWDYPFETGITTDAYMIILLRTLEINDEELISRLAKRILSKQEKNGAWKLFHDENEGNLTATVEAYYGLLYSGYSYKEDSRMKAAKKFILQNGGIEKINIYTKIMLAITGQYKWPAFFPVPVEFILLPLSFPLNFYQFSEYGRVNLAPILILSDQKFRLKTKRSPYLSDLFSNTRADDDWGFNPEWRTLSSSIKESIKSLLGIPAHLHSLAVDQAKNYILERVEPDGTFYNYFSATFLMIFALMSLGYSKNDPLIVKAIEGLKSMKTEINGLPHMQYTTADVWNTSLISMALQIAEVSPEDPVIKKANSYLLTRQQQKIGDWVIHNPDGLPGGWGFADQNTLHPDIDDTTASLRSISRAVPDNPQYQSAWNRGMNWLLSMQNDDGGWASFEKNVDSPWIDLIPIKKSEFIFADPSSADLTGRTLEFLGNYTNLPGNHQIVNKAEKWVVKNQEKDGSWYGRWGICYLYGTWSAVTGLTAVGHDSNHKSIRQAVDWIKSIQNSDGGWGESCKSDIEKRYIPLGKSTLTHTAWALDSLIAVEERPTKEIQRGIDYLIASIEKDDWTTYYPKGQLLAGAFYNHYHSYRYIFPLSALSHYKQKYE